MIKLTANPSEQYLDKALEALDVLANENGPGNDFLGWKKLPTTTPESLFEECDEVVKNWKEQGVEVVVAIGIGGSYLGAKATIEHCPICISIYRKRNVGVPLYSLHQ